MSKSLKKKQGQVVSKTGDKTIKVKIVSKKTHPFYKKIIKVTSFFLVHDHLNQAKLGDIVSFVSCRPISARKTWRLVEVSGESK